MMLECGAMSLHQARAHFRQDLVWDFEMHEALIQTIGPMGKASNPVRKHPDKTAQSSSIGLLLSSNQITAWY